MNVAAPPLDPGALLAEHAPVLLVVLDLAGTIQHVNPYFERLTGFCNQELQGKNWFETLLPARDRDKVAALFSHATGGHPTTGNINPIVLRNGEERAIEWYDQMQRDDAGKPLRLVTIGIDVTERERERQRAERAEVERNARAKDLQVIADHLPVSLTYVDHEQRFRFANQVHSTSHNTTPAATLGKTVCEVIGEDAYQHFRPLIERALGGEDVLSIEPFEAPGGEPKTYEVRLLPDRDPAGKVVGYFSMVIDMTERTRQERALRRSDARLREAQQIAQLGSWELDLVSHDLHWSDEAFRIFEIDTTSFGASYEAFLDLIHPDDRTMVDQAYTRSVATRTPYELVHRLVMKSGRVKYVQERCQTEYDESGQPIRSAGTVQDITERIRTETELRDTRDRLDATLQAIPDLLFEVDVDGRYLAFHGRDSTLLPVPPDQLIGRTVRELLPNEAAIVALDALDEAARTGSSFGHVYTLTLANRTHWFELSIARKSPIQGSAPTFVALARDVTARRNAEDSVRELNAQLDQRVRERTAELEAANRKLEAYGYTVSHDLKAPLRAMEGYGRLLREDYAATVGARGLHLIQSIEQAAVRMNRLIDDLLTYSRLHHRALQPIQIDVASLLRTLVEERAQDLETRGIATHVAVTCDHVFAEPYGVTLALRNLLDNAIKHGCVAPQPEINIGAHEEDAGWLLWIRDNGAGIASNDQARAFDLYERLPSLGDNSGTGIGLAIVRAAIERVRGKVWMESAPGEGATFYIQLPR